MLTHVNPSVAVCEEKSGHIWPQKGPFGTLFMPNLAGYRALGPHPAPCGQVLGGFDTLRGYLPLHGLQRPKGAGYKNL